MFTSPQKLIDAVKGRPCLDLADKIFALELQAPAQNIVIGIQQSTGSGNTSLVFFSNPLSPL